MAHRGVFGHLVLRMSPHPENVATEALAYVLGESPSVLEAFHALLGRAAPTMPTIRTVRTQATGDDGGIPDLVGYDDAGLVRFLGEAKFEAGLTEHQPVTYLRRLSDETGGVLLFLAPSKRLDVLWTELMRRTEAAGLEVGARTDLDEYRWVTIGEQRILALISWRALLRSLVEAAIVTGDLAAQGDLDQLAGLCDRMDDAVFTPLTSEELTGSAPSRSLQFLDIVDRATAQLISNGTAKRTDERGSSLTGASGRGYSGRYLALGDVTTLLRVSWTHWAGERATPLWLQVGYKGQPPTADCLAALRPLQQTGRLFEHSFSADVAIDVPTGVDLPEVVSAVVAQVEEVGQLLKTGLPTRTSS